MGDQDEFERTLASLHDAMLDNARWPGASALIDEACGLTGNDLIVSEGTKDDVRVLFVGAYCRGQRREDEERDYLENYYPTDERVPRVRRLPDSRLVRPGPSRAAGGRRAASRRRGRGQRVDAAPPLARVAPVRDARQAGGRSSTGLRRAARCGAGADRRARAPASCRPRPGGENPAGVVDDLPSGRWRKTGRRTRGRIIRANDRARGGAATGCRTRRIGGAANSRAGRERRRAARCRGKVFRGPLHADRAGDRHTGSGRLKRSGYRSGVAVIRSHVAHHLPCPIRRQPHQSAGLAHVRLAIPRRAFPVESPQMATLTPGARRAPRLLLRHQPCRCVFEPLGQLAIPGPPRTGRRRRRPPAYRRPSPMPTGRGSCRSACRSCQASWPEPPDHPFQLPRAMPECPDRAKIRTEVCLHEET